jgi:hypothetical protein
MNEVKDRMKERRKKGKKRKERKRWRGEEWKEEERKEKKMNMKIQVKCHSFLKGLLLEQVLRK